MKKSILQKILAFFARATIRKYNPTVISITGSVGKTSTKDAIYTVLKKKYNVRKNEKSLNTEIGLPLAILGAENHYTNVFGWIKELIKIVWKFLVSYNYPKILVLEYGVQKPGDMNYLLSIAKPNMAVVAAIGDIPVHVEFFNDPEDVIKEKTKLVKALSVDGYCIVNHDDLAVYDMKKETKAHTMSYGFEEHATVRIGNYELLTIIHEERGEVPSGITFKIYHEGNVVPVRLRRTFGKPQAYAAAAATAIGSALGMNLVAISEALQEYEPPPGRMRLLEGIKNSFILDDSYNAAPESMRAAMDTLQTLPGRRKIAVLGDMLEIGKYSEQAHRAIGDRVAEFVDLLVTVGPRAKFIADEAMTRGVEQNTRKLMQNQVMKFDDSVSAGKAIDPLIENGDLILIKGSQALRMEKAVIEIMRYPEKASELLVRQDEFWKKK